MKSGYIIGILCLTITCLSGLGFTQVKGAVDDVETLKTRVTVLERENVLLHTIDSKLDILIPEVAEIRTKIEYLERAEK